MRHAVFDVTVVCGELSEAEGIGRSRTIKRTPGTGQTSVAPVRLPKAACQFGLRRIALRCGGVRKPPFPLQKRLMTPFLCAIFCGVLPPVMFHIVALRRPEADHWHVAAHAPADENLPEARMTARDNSWLWASGLFSISPSILQFGAVILALMPVFRSFQQVRPSDIA